MYLHEDRQVFEELVIATSENQGRPIDIVEKDYYVTMILSQIYNSIYMFGIEVIALVAEKQQPIKGV